jgi:serine/threonine protein kinase
MAYVEELRRTGPFPEPNKFAGFLVRDGILTHFQAEQILQGKWRRFTIGKYQVLERVGSGRVGSVYLCKHTAMPRPVAVKVLPTACANDPRSLERFYREARALASLLHPNVVRAYDIAQDDTLHFLVMEYVEGSSLRAIVEKSGPMDVTHAAHYIRQAALGLKQIDERGMVDRDVKPDDILLDRSGIVKIIDMGCVQFAFDREEHPPPQLLENLRGAADYMAPELAHDPCGVDIRADIYSLGATFYFCLTGRAPFGEGTEAQKVVWHQARSPERIQRLRPEVPDALAAVIEHMMAKDPAQRPQTPKWVVDALAPYIEQPIGPPPEEWMPYLSPAARAQLNL